MCNCMMVVKFHDDKLCYTNEMLKMSKVTVEMLANVMKVTGIRSIENLTRTTME